MEKLPDSIPSTVSPDTAQKNLTSPGVPLAVRNTDWTTDLLKYEGSFLCLKALKGKKKKLS